MAAALGLPVVAVLVAPTQAVAQDYTSGVLTGRVSDETGAPVSGAAVTVTSGQGVVRDVATGADGQFRMPALPVGSYTVSIEGAGYQPTTQQVSVSPGGSTYSFTVASDAYAVDEVVITARRVQDFSRTDIGLTVDVQEFAEQVPTGRSINSITLFTPGATQPDASINASAHRNQSLVSLSGTSAAESVYYINGLNVTDQRNFLGYADLPFDFIQTIETKSGGYQAEFGRGTGGVVNIVTRSGTNEWTGGISAHWTPGELRANRGVAYAPPGTGTHGSEVLNSFAESSGHQVALHLGGPILRDRLFFFGVYEHRESDAAGAVSYSRAYNTGFPDNMAPRDTGGQAFSYSDDPRWAVKLDFVINPDHRIEATVMSDETTTESYTVTRNANFEEVDRTGMVYSESGGLNQIYKYTGVFTDWFTLSALYGRVENAYRDTGDPVSMPGVRDYGQPGNPWLTSGRFALYELDGEDVRETYRVDGDFYFNAFGDHHLRIGYDREDLESFARSFYSGGGLYYGWSNAYYDAGYCAADGGLIPDRSVGCVNIVTYGNDGTFTAEQSAFYIQDSWDVTPNLNVQLGVRNDRYDYRNVDGESYIALDDQWAPRVGFNWDPTGSGVSRIFGSMGDYYLPIALNTSIRASSGEIYTDAYYVAVRNPDGSLQLDADGYPVLGPQYQLDYLSPPAAPDPRSVIEADLEPMYEREFILGYEHRFTGGMFDNWTAGITYIHRELKQTIEDTAIGDAVYRYCVRTGNADCGPLPTTNAGARTWSSMHPYVLLNPGDEARVFLDLAGEPRGLGDGSPNPAYNPQWITLTEDDLMLPQAEREMDAVQLTFARPYDGVWSLQGSYTWMNSEGNYEGAVKSDTGQTDTSLTQDYDHAGNQFNAHGYLPNHREHTFKIFGNYSPTDFMNVGAAFTAQSGRHYGCIGQMPDSVEPLQPQGSPPSAWYCPLGPGNSAIPTPRGSQGETDWTYQLDLNFSFDLLRNTDRGSLTASVDIFNVFDNDEAVRVVEQGWVRNGSNAAADATQRSNFYGLPRSYQTARYVRFGVRYRF